VKEYDIPKNLQLFQQYGREKFLKNIWASERNCMEDSNQSRVVEPM
jgi:hypothetical protein